MVANHDRLFRVSHGSALVGEAESVRHLREGVAVLHATGSVQMPWRASLPKRRLSRQTVVAVKTAGGWRVAALHNGRQTSGEDPRSGLVPGAGVAGPDACRRRAHIGRAR